MDINFTFSCSPKDCKLKKMANMYGNMHSFVKIQAENSAMKKMSHKKHYMAILLVPKSETQGFDTPFEEIAFNFLSR